MSGVDQNSPAGMAMPTIQSSPSFQGDDVDAIFHNLAHLDANEWTDTRAGAFKEFGFTDNLTFQAFCDDPERLAAPAKTQDPGNGPSVDFWQPDAVAPFSLDDSSAEPGGWWS
jgi:hypothetical protein